MKNLHDLFLSLTDAEVLAQARRVSDGKLPEDRVAMGSTVTYVEEPAGKRRTVTLAYPAQADFALGKISVLSPIGRALIGRRRGETIDAVLPGRKLQEIRVLSSEQLREPLREAA